MSADNGYILRRNSAGEFVLQMYFASAEEYPDVEATAPEQKFETLPEAIAAYEELDDGYGSEYGLRVSLK